MSNQYIGPDFMELRPQSKYQESRVQDVSIVGQGEQLFRQTYAVAEGNC